MRKIKYILLLFLVLLIFLIIVFFRVILNNNINNAYETNETLNNESYSFTDEEIKKYEEFNEKSMWTQITRFVEKNGDWSDIPLTKHFREKYNEKDGILGDISFDTVEYCPYEEGRYPFTYTSYFVITQGKKKIAYNYVMYDIGVVINDDGYSIGLVDDIELSSPIVFVDENGNELDTRLKCTEENWDTILNSFVSQELDVQHTVAVTYRFSSLYYDYQDIYLQKIPSHKDFTSVIYSMETIEQSDYNTLTAVYRCFNLTNINEKRLYRVHFILDDKQYIDDVEIEILEQ